jgi:hypothetical protein
VLPLRVWSESICLDCIGGITNLREASLLLLLIQVMCLESTLSEINVLLHLLRYYMYLSVSQGKRERLCICLFKPTSDKRERAFQIEMWNGSTHLGVMSGMKEFIDDILENISRDGSLIRIIWMIRERWWRRQINGRLHPGSTDVKDSKEKVKELQGDMDNYEFICFISFLKIKEIWK